PTRREAMPASPDRWPRRWRWPWPAPAPGMHACVAFRRPRSVIERAVAEVAEVHLAATRGIDRRLQRQELPGHVVVVAGHLHLHGVLFPALAVAAGVEGDDVLVVGHPQPQLAALARRQAFHRTLLAVAVHDEALAVAAHADVEAVAVEQHRAADRARLDLQFPFELLGLVAGDHGQRRAVGRGAALALHAYRAVAEGQADVLVPARVVKRPLVPEGRAVEGVGQRHAMRTDGLAAGLAQRLAEVAAAGQEPAVVGPLDRLQQRLPAKGPVSVLVAVVDHPPAAVGTFDHGGVAARPPRFVAAPGAGDRIVRRVLPRPVDRLGARGDHHVSGRRAGGAAHRGGHVVPLPALVDLRAFLGVALDVPALGVLPAVVD